MSTQSEKLTAIANAIRTAEGTTEPIPAADFPTRIAVLTGGGGSDLSMEQIANAAHIAFAATAGDNTLHLRTQTGGYDCTIHWGDGTSTEAPTDGGNVIHNYAEAGTYHIFITGNSFAGFYVNWETGGEKYIVAYSMGKWETDTMTDLSYCFMGCDKLTQISAGLFDYNTEVTSFYCCFAMCTSLTSIPAGIFEKNTKVTSFYQCFSRCSALEYLPPRLFEKNIEATNFCGCLNFCSSLLLRDDIFGRDTDTRFVGKTMNFSSCFSRTSYSGSAAGNAPEIWNFTMNSASKSISCFGGAGNSETSLKNYADIPAAWK